VQTYVRADPQGGPRTQRQVWAQCSRRVLYVMATHAYVYIITPCLRRVDQVKRCTTTAFWSLASSMVRLGLSSSLEGNVVWSRKGRLSGRALRVSHDAERTHAATKFLRSPTRWVRLTFATILLVSVIELCTHLVPSPSLICTLVVGLLGSTSNPFWPCPAAALGPESPLVPSGVPERIPPGMFGVWVPETTSGVGLPRRLPEPSKGRETFGGGRYGSLVLCATSIWMG
jgi:hypothetical protein